MRGLVSFHAVDLALVDELVVRPGAVVDGCGRESFLQDRGLGHLKYLLAPLFAALVRPSLSVGRASLVAALWTVVATTVVASWFPATLEGYFGVSPGASASNS